MFTLCISSDGDGTAKKGVFNCAEMKFILERGSCSPPKRQYRLFEFIEEDMVKKLKLLFCLEVRDKRDSALTLKRA